jgi:hypothetical protein
VEAQGSPAPAPIKFITFINFNIFVTFDMLAWRLRSCR